MVAGTYGQVENSFSLFDYRNLASETGFRLDSHEDITRNTLPTYPVVRHLFDETGNSEGCGSFGTTRLSR